ncbi:MAG: cobalt transporter CbiM [Bryobacterales bacterium]|nr:cobalt transporter CbiM [Bryobacterales bacterium]
MHIADGILPVSLCAVGYVVALAGSALGSRKLQPEDVPRMGLLAAATFVASTAHFPIAGASVHFGLFGLLGLILGLRALPVIFAVLLLQTFLFQHGGFLTLGVNAMNMGAGAVCGFLLGRLPMLPLPLRGFLAGFAGVIIPALLLLAEFQFAGYGRSLTWLAGIYAGLGGIEGAFTALVVFFLQRTRPAVFSVALAPVRIAAKLPDSPFLERQVP